MTNGIRQCQKGFTSFMGFAEIKITVVFKTILGRLIQKHSLKGVFLNKCSEIFCPKSLKNTCEGVHF